MMARKEKWESDGITLRKGPAELISKRKEAFLWHASQNDVKNMS
jgi:hypothetical protein